MQRQGEGFISILLTLRLNQQTSVVGKAGKANLECDIYIFRYRYHCDCARMSAVFCKDREMVDLRGSRLVRVKNKFG